MRGSWRGLPFWQATPALRLWISLLVVGAAAVSVRSPGLSSKDLAALAALVGIAVFEVEVGRQAEGGQVHVQRAHKGLSAWPFAAAMLCTSTLGVLITIPTYAYARHRGFRIPLHKWVGSGALLSIAAAAVQPCLPALHGATALPRVLAGMATFLLLEAAAFAVCARAGDPADEQWLKDQLRSRAFYGNEVAVLCQGTLIAVLWNVSPPLVLVVLPSYAVLQRALLHAPLRKAAETDAKTGLLLLDAWERRAAAVLDKSVAFSVVLVDLDHFKQVNDRHGHLVGDDVLRAVAHVLATGLRPGDELGRFGGEEFCILLPDSDVREAVAVAERLRAAVGDHLVEGLPLTASFGVYASEPVASTRLREALACADLALYAAKSCGRNVVRSHRPAQVRVLPVQRSEQVPAAPRP